MERIIQVEDLSIPQTSAVVLELRAIDREPLIPGTIPEDKFRSKPHISGG